MQQRAFLQGIASIRSGNGPVQEEEKKSDFKAVSVANFRERMMKEELMEKEETISK
jgi:hypothetical protein